MTPLLTACTMGCAEVVQELLDRGADVNKTGDDGATPLLTASRLGFRVVVQTLVEAGADLEKASKGGETPLLGAVRERKSEVVLLLLKAGAGPDPFRTCRIRSNQTQHSRTPSKFRPPSPVQARRGSKSASLRVDSQVLSQLYTY